MASAQLVVHVVPVGQPGLIQLVVDNVGPELLSKEEMVQTLRMAADQVESQGILG